MALAIYQIDAFTDVLYRGNPAAVVPLDVWQADELLQSIAAENNLSETAFFVPRDCGFELRWFTPEVEVDLCGHATLAAAHVLVEHLGYSEPAIRFFSRHSGELLVTKSEAGLTLDFPALPMRLADSDLPWTDLLGAAPRHCYEAMQGEGPLMLVYTDIDDVAGLQPDFAALSASCEQPVIATAPGEGAEKTCDFVSRFFAPSVGIDEDPVTGSAHCYTTPYWAERLDSRFLRARQISRRGGDLVCELRGERVLITGSAVTYMTGKLAPLAARLSNL